MQHTIDRRMALAGLIAAAGVGMMGSAAAEAAPRRKFFERIGKPIGLQLYTLGDAPEKDLEGTLAKVAAIGFRDLELPSLLGKTPAELKAAAARHGVNFSCIHLAALPFMPPTALTMLSPAQRLVDELGALGVKHAVLPINLLPEGFQMKPGEGFLAALMRGSNEQGVDGWKRTAAVLNEKAAALKPHGISVGYHNHNHEFAPIGKTSGWEVLVKETDKSLVGFEVDLGWIAASGRDPVAFLNRHKGRVRWVHVKDVKATTVANYLLKMDPTEVGSGKLDWARVLPAARKAGCEHFYLEQEPPFNIERIDAAAKGFAFLKSLRP
jgi:sugar phosphate isomerase/epimerase